MFNKLPENINDFNSIILRETIAAIKLNRFSENYDYCRYSKDGIDRSTIFDVESSEKNFTWYFLNLQRIYNAYSALTDNTSKRLYLHLLAFRLGGHLSVKIPVEFSESKKDNLWSNYQKFEYSTTSEIKIQGNNTIRHFDFEYEGTRYLADVTHLKHYLHRKQYFFNRNKVSIEPKNGDVILDCGACLGDTAVVFGNTVGKKGKVFAFDPVDTHLKVLRYNAEQNPDLNIEIIPTGVSNNCIDADPILSEKFNPGFNSISRHVPLQTIDKFVSDKDLKNVNFIKMDIEGSELFALEGALKTLETFQPKLAISIYHHFDDFFSIINFLKERSLYTFFGIGHYTIHKEETVLYCA